jgi:hypothetical protein
VTITNAEPPPAEVAARDRLAKIRSILAEDRAAFHEGVIAASSGRSVPADPTPAPLPVNAHPGPDFYPRAAA